MKISEALHAASATLFPKVEGERRPDYKGLFVHTVCAVLDGVKAKYDKATVEKIAAHINLSSLQRASAAEAARRYGPGDKSGGPRMAPIKSTAEAKPKKTGVAAIDGVKRRKDPITGEPVKKAAPAKAKKAATAKTKKTPAKEATAAPKVKKEVAPKKAPATAAPKTKKATKAPELDPITGEPV